MERNKGEQLTVKNTRTKEEGYITHNPLDGRLAISFGLTPLGKPQKIAVMEMGKYKLTEEAALKLAQFSALKDADAQMLEMKDIERRSRIAVPATIVTPKVDVVIPKAVTPKIEIISILDRIGSIQAKTRNDILEVLRNISTGRPGIDNFRRILDLDI